MAYATSLLMLVVLNGYTPAQDQGKTFAWKLVPKQKLAWTFENSFTFNSTDGTNTNKGILSVTFDFDVEVEKQVDGNTTLSVTVSRHRMKSDAPGSGEAEFDSAAKTPQIDPQGNMAKVSKEMLELNFKVIQDRHGRIVEMDIPESIQKRLLTPTHDPIKFVLEKAGFASLRVASFTAFPPSAIKKGDEWKSESAIPFFVLGPTNFTHTARYVGEEKVDGTTLSKFELKVEIAKEKLASIPVKTTQDSTGVMYFDPELGRVTKSAWKFEFGVENGNEKATIIQEISSSIKEAPATKAD